ncbi:hypothetical protein Ddye_012583 [Dipteronia dyeriana]|uniref:Uncharacterized protein n=1 Tax=Dipteronia dyeriana TaxID=168575 RepID=A0AAD9X4Q9_9ROSI|nr:hypothetical protein Ddye_012583 [Dipteronia dyeriana]
MVRRSLLQSLRDMDVSRVRRDLSIVDNEIPSLLIVAKNAFLTCGLCYGCCFCP